MNQRRSASHLLRRATRLVMPPISPIVRPLPPADRLEAADGFRTRDLELGKLALYQLSYRRRGLILGGTQRLAAPLRCAIVTMHVDRGEPSVVIAHYFTEVYGGAERIVAAIAALFPDAPSWSILGRR